MSIILKLKVPSENQIQGIRISVYTMSPRSFKFDFLNYVSQTPIICCKKDAINITKNEWFFYYGDVTEIEYIEHKEVDMSNFCVKSSSSACRN